MWLQGAGVNSEPSERVELPVVGRLVTPQRCPQCAQRVVAARAPVLERRAEEVELRIERPDAEAKDHSSVADVIQCAVALYDCKRMVIAKHQGHGGESDLFRASRQVAESGERIPVPGAAPCGLRRRHTD